MPLSRPLALLDRLIAFPTVSRESNLALIDYVRDLLAPLGARLTLVPNAEGSKANLHAVLGPAGGGGVLLSGHTDVVPVEGQAWTSDPFRLTARGDRLLGRGTCDMKGFLACALAAAEQAAARRLTRPLHLAFSYDEEIGCVGVRGLIERLVGAPDLPALCVIGEPTLLETVIAHKGKLAARVTCRGRECHSSHAPEGLNAIHLAADMLAEMRLMQDELAAGPRDEAYAVPFTTVHAGTIQGGTALNIVPNGCTMEFEIRNLPADDPSLLMDRLFDKAAALTRAAEARFPGTGVSVDIVNAYPGLETPPEAEVVTMLRRLNGEGPLRKIAFGTEGGLFREKLGIPTVVCGPGDIRDAHKPDEYVSRDQLARCAGMLGRLVDEISA
ncbi:acetylornithine deacetylase [Ancylobacter sp. IITR112]|uniref:acetylornithine deacetylase n=1 Tax=Ancylobacter sp. IITR112 TaxID=3138073 RepID=UPI00352A69D3